MPLFPLSLPSALLLQLVYHRAILRLLGSTFPELHIRRVIVVFVVLGTALAVLLEGLMVRTIAFDIQRYVKNF